MTESIRSGDTVFFSVNFYNTTGGYSAVSQLPPTWAVFRNSETAPFLTGTMVARGGTLIGSYIGSFITSSINGFLPGQFYEVQAIGRINGRPVSYPVKTFVLDDMVNANVVAVSGVPASMVSIVDANVVSVSGVKVSLANFNEGSSGGTVNAQQVWEYPARALTGVPPVNVVEVSGVRTSVNHIAKSTWNEFVSDH